MAEAIRELGCDTLKTAVTPKYADDYLMTEDPEIKGARDLGCDQGAEARLRRLFSDELTLRLRVGCRSILRRAKTIKNTIKPLNGSV